MKVTSNRWEVYECSDGTLVIGVEGVDPRDEPHTKVCIMDQKGEDVKALANMIVDLWNQECALCVKKDVIVTTLYTEGTITTF